jgi:hypothetical protein
LVAKVNELSDIATGEVEDDDDLDEAEEDEYENAVD